ncbi:MAG: hypothetical protein R2991_15760 [Thermoanaerobaculia bacterium]
MSDSARLCVVFVQKERRKYPSSLFRVLEVAARFEAWEPHVIVVDNDREGAWQHPVAARLTHLGGDNSDWEFSAFDRGIRWARENLGPPEVFVLVTDACLAYGDDYLDLVRPEAAEIAVRDGACVGWIDSFGEVCDILGHEYDAWLRTSFVLLPDAVLGRVEPLAEELPVERIFGPGPAQPFALDAPVSRNLQRLITAWLTSNPELAVDLEETWHSGFLLSPETFPFFRDKARSILREHLLSARLHALGVDAYDLRVVRSLSGVSKAEIGDWTWLRGVMRYHRAEAPPTPPSRARIVLAADWTTESSRLTAALLAREVLPLLRQRWAGVSLALLGSTDTSMPEVAGSRAVTLAAPSDALEPWIDGASVLVLAPGSDPLSERAEALAIERGVPVVRDLVSAAAPSAPLLAMRLSGCLEGLGEA